MLCIAGRRFAQGSCNRMHRRDDIISFAPSVVCILRKLSPVQGFDSVPFDTVALVETVPLSRTASTTTAPVRQTWRLARLFTFRAYARISSGVSIFPLRLLGHPRSTAPRFPVSLPRHAHRSSQALALPPPQATRRAARGPRRAGRRSFGTASWDSLSFGPRWVRAVWSDGAHGASLLAR